MKRIAILVSALLVSFSSFALDLDSAKDEGLVGEQLNGYLGVIKSSSEVDALVGNINRQRKLKYTEIATRQKVSLSAIENLAGKKLTERAAAEKEFYQTESGNWKR